MARTLGLRCTLAAASAASLLCALLLSPVADPPSRARAQQPQPALTIAQVDASAYPEVHAVVTAVDANGVPAPSLTQAQFQAFDGTTPLTVTGVQAAQDANIPLAVVIAIDVSGSMAGQSLDRAKQAATEFVQNLGPNDTAAIVTFAATVTPLVPFFTNSKVQLTDAIANLGAAGGTALYEAVQVSASKAAGSGSNRRAIVLLTDGQNVAVGSTATADGAVFSATAAGVPVFTIGFGDAPDAAFLQRLSGSTQGQYRPATAATVSSVYADIAALLRAQYLLTLRSTAPADGADAALRIVATIAGVPAAATASFRRGASALPVAQPTAVASAEPQPAATRSGGSSVTVIVFGLLIALAVLGGVAFFYARLRRRRRLLRMQRAVVEPNPRLAAAQGVPQQSRAGAPDADSSRGRLFSLNGDAPGPAVEFGAQPIRIGSSPECDLRLAPSPDVAPRHALVWARDGKLMLRHVGGPTRATTVAGRSVTWVILEEGDEFAIGPHRYRAERIRGA